MKAGHAAPPSASWAETAEESVARLRTRLDESLHRILERYRGRLEIIRSHYIFQQPLNLVRQYQLRIDDLANRTRKLIAHHMELDRHRLQNLTKQLQTVNPHAVLDRGYSLTISAADGKTITDAAMLQKGERIRTELRKGSFTSVVDDVTVEKMDKKS